MDITPVRFIWFVVVSWRYKKGSRKGFFKGLMPAWRSYNYGWLVDTGKIEPETKTMDIEVPGPDNGKS